MKNSTPASRNEKSNGQGQGMNWIRQSTRLSIYLRDGLSCCYCGASVENGTQLTLDHLVPYSKGGSNAPANLVTCCQRCNSSRGNRPVATFCRAVAEYVNHGATAGAILAHVRACAKRKLDRATALEMISRRGSVAAVLSGN
jgi:HNH endonuclease